MEDKKLATVLSARRDKYGPFINNATISQDLKEILHKSTNWEAMPPDMKEALHMIVHKISRIVEGDFNYDDSWIDISGYSTLIVERLHNLGIVSSLKEDSEKNNS